MYIKKLFNKNALFSILCDYYLLIVQARLPVHWGDSFAPYKNNPTPADPT
jgi:hypothetical protein